MANTHIFKDAVIDDDKHEPSLQAEAGNRKGHLITKGAASLENLYDLQECFQGLRNNKTHNSTMMHVLINLGTKQDPKFVNIGIGYTQQERQSFVRLFKQYQDVFMWTYDDLKTYDMWIIRHIIPMKE